MKKFVLWAFGILHIKITDEQAKTIAQFIGFALVGVTNTAISFAVYSLLLKFIPFFNIGRNYIIANAIAFVVSVTNSFIWNNKYVFKKGSGETRSLALTYIKTFLSYGITGLLLANVLLYFAVNNFGWNKYLANLVIIIITIPINFIMNKLWAFSTRKSKEKTEIDHTNTDEN